MSGTLPQMYSDQFEQAPAKGDLDLAIMRSGVIAGTFYSVTPTDTLAAGSRVALDTTNTAPGNPRFVAVADNAAAFGVVKRNSKKALFAVGDAIEVAYIGGPVVYECANATVTPGMDVEMASGFVQEKSAGTKMGLALDYALVSQMLRVIIGFVSC